MWIEDEEVDEALWLRAMQRFNDVEPVLQAGFGRELALDARGEARVPSPSDALCLASALGDLHGDGRLLPGDTECVLELQAYHALTVLVVDDSGRPLEHALVALYWGEPDPWAHSMQWTADEHGKVWLPKLEGQVHEEGYGGELRVTLASAPCEPEHVAFTLADVPTEPVRLVAGDAGRVVIQLTDALGAEQRLEGFAGLRVMPESAAELPPHLRRSQSMWSRIMDGQAVFEPVGLFLSLDVTANAQDHGNEGREVQGPRAPGETVLVRMMVGSRQGTARGRVQGIDELYGQAEPRGARLTGKALNSSFDVWLESDGPFEARIVPQYEASHLQELQVPWSLELSRGIGGPALVASATPRLDAQACTLDFGDLPLAPPAAVVRLRVMGQGQPVPHAWVVVGDYERMVQCDEEGRCALNAETLSLPVAVCATHPDWLPSAWADVAEGSEEHVLDLRQGATLEGRLLLPDWDSTGLQIALVPDAAALREEDKPRRAKLNEGGSFRFNAFEPGLATLVISIGGARVHERSGIDLRAGETTDVGTIDLRAALYTFELTFALAEGAAWRSGAFVVREPGGELSLRASIGVSGRVRFLSPRPEIDVWALGQGASATLFEEVSDGQRLTLAAPACASLRLPSGFPLPPGPLVLSVRGERLQPEEVEWDGIDYFPAEGSVGGDGAARLEAPCSGTYELSWSLYNPDTGAQLEIEQAEFQTVVVPEPPEEPVIEVTLPAEAVERAVRAAGG